MENETNKVTAPADNGLTEVSAKMDKFLAGIEQSKKEAAETLQAAKDAQEKAEKALNEAVAAKNAHPVNFAPAKKADKAQANKDIRSFLADIKTAHFGGQTKAALSTDAETGSNLVPTDYVPTLVDLLVKYPAYINDAYRLDWGLVGNERDIPNLAARPSVVVVGEGAKKPVSNPAFGLIHQKLVKAAAIVVWTRELASDAMIDLQALLPSIIGPQFTTYFNTWLFQGNGQYHPGIFNASGVLTPNVTQVNELIALKLAVPYQFRATGKFYVETSLYGQLASIARLSAPSWLYYENGVMKIDGSDVVAVDATIIGAGKACFGDMKTVTFSPKGDLVVRWSDMASIVDNSGAEPVTHNLYQENKEAYLFEARADISVVGSVWATADLGESESN